MPYTVRGLSRDDPAGARQISEKVVRFTQGKTFAEYLADDLLRLNRTPTQQSF